MTRKFLFFSEYGEIAFLATYLQEVEGHEVLLYIHGPKEKKIADGVLEHIDDWFKYLGQGYVWVFDSCGFGGMQDWLRERGEAVFGGSEEADKLENERQLAQEWFSEAGFDQVESENFKDFAAALAFVQKHRKQRWILKQNGNAPKSLNHMGKFPNSEDMIFHLEELKKKWNEHSFGPIDFDLMEVVEGVEVAASAFWNGHDYMRNAEGKVVGFLNFEEKKESDGGLGETTGEMGTTFLGVTEDHELFREILMRPKVVERLKDINFRGVFDINCIKTRDGLVALEPTCRPGFPATAYEFINGITSNVGAMLEAVAKGKDAPVSVRMGWGMVMCVVAKPFPIDDENQVNEDYTSLGEKLWILHNGEPADDFTPEQKKRIHLYNFSKTDDGTYKVATKCGYLLYVVDNGSSVKAIRDKLIKYIRKNIYVSGMKYRQDIGARIEPHEQELANA